MKLFSKKEKLTLKGIDGKFQNLVAQLNLRFGGLDSDVETAYGNHDRLSKEFHELRDELATNGVIRDLRAAQKQIAELQDSYAALATEFVQYRRTMETNGVATAINKLAKEVFGKKKEDGSIIGRVITRMAGIEPLESVTLAGKVDAIIEHLGLDITVKPREVIESKVVTKKVKTQKKGRK